MPEWDSITSYVAKREAETAARWAESDALILSIAQGQTRADSPVIARSAAALQEDPEDILTEAQKAYAAEMGIRTVAPLPGYQGVMDQRSQDASGSAYFGGGHHDITGTQEIIASLPPADDVNGKQQENDLSQYWWVLVVIVVLVFLLMSNR